MDAYSGACRGRRWADGRSIESNAVVHRDPTHGA
jgi:hypothetical protein